MPNQRNTPSSSQAPSRQSTESSQPEPLRTRTTTGFKSLTVARSQTPVKDVKEDWYEVYHLPWSRLKAWLEQRFPGHTFEERTNVKNDHYLFEVPEKLTPAERAAILELRTQRDFNQDLEIEE